MSTPIYAIRERQPVFPCWLWDNDIAVKPHWVRWNESVWRLLPPNMNRLLEAHFTHWSPDTPTAPTITPTMTPPQTPTPEPKFPATVWLCAKCEHTFAEPDGRQHRDGDIDQWCPKCGASDDHWHQYESLDHPRSTIAVHERETVQLHQQLESAQAEAKAAISMALQYRNTVEGWIDQLEQKTGFRFKRYRSGEVMAASSFVQIEAALKELAQLRAANEEKDRTIAARDQTIKSHQSFYDQLYASKNKLEEDFRAQLSSLTAERDALKAELAQVAKDKPVWDWIESDNNEWRIDLVGAGCSVVESARQAMKAQSDSSKSST